MAPARVAAGVLLAAIGFVLSVVADNPTTTSPQPFVWQKAHATFYGGTRRLRHDGWRLRCYKIACDRKRADLLFCKPGVTVTVTATNFCPPNDALPNDNGGWCNPSRPHFDMAQPAWEKIGVYRGGIIPVMYQRVPCVKRGGVKFRINGHDYFNLVLVSNVAAAGSIKSMDVKSSNSDDWMPMARDWGANWHSLANLTNKMLSFRLTNTDGHILVFNNVVPKGWNFGQSFVSKLQFY
ncbi:hypothetical protein CFC21_039179 [Triticum aestivum]|uniref:Expansin n=3 Tax=Triticum TaxID=4564 RepID=A0A9R1FFV4_WHEAT|nr:hypothetical protein CFC21_039177 [Triticum aestivum]KAF7027107.1 hypothetical protein CFC21_039179 [Triticum aestivum]